MNENKPCPDCAKTELQIGAAITHEKLKEGERRFATIEDRLETFTKDIKNIADEFGESGRQFKDQMLELMKTMNIMINGDAQAGIMGYDAKLKEHDRKINLIIWIGSTIGSGLIAALSYLSYRLFERIDSALAIIEAAQKAVK